MEITKIDKPNAYTPNAWQGKSYDSNLSIKEIAEIIRHFIKKQYPEIKVSVTSDRGRAIKIALMQAPYSIWSTPDANNLPRYGYGSDEQKLEYWKKTIEKGHHTVNHHHSITDTYLNEKGREIMNFFKKCADVYNYDDSDAMIDYFNTNFYLTLSVGKWDKPFIIKN